MNWCCVCDTEGCFQTYLDTRDIESGERFAIARCQGCGILQTLPVPEDLSRYYAGELGRAMVTATTPLHHALKRLLLAHELRRILRYGQPPCVLDVGCGTGDFARLMARHKLKVAAADATPAPPAQLQQHSAIAYHQIDYGRYTLTPSASLGGGMVVVRHVLEHLKNPRRFLTQMQAYGAASFYMVVPNAGSLERRVMGPIWNFWDPPRHLWHFDDQSLAKLCQGAGLTIVARGHDTIPNVVPSFYRWLRLRGVPARAARPFHPKGTLSSLAAPLNLFLPGNVLWAIAQVNSSPHG